MFFANKNKKNRKHINKYLSNKTREGDGRMGKQHIPMRIFPLVMLLFTVYVHTQCQKLSRAQIQCCCKSMHDHIPIYCLDLSYKNGPQPESKHHMHQGSRRIQSIEKKRNGSWRDSIRNIFGTEFNPPHVKWNLDQTHTKLFKRYR